MSNCPKCRSAKVTMQGWRVRAGGKRERKAQCQNCGHWMTLRASAPAPAKKPAKKKKDSSRL